MSLSTLSRHRLSCDALETSIASRLDRYAKHIATNPCGPHGAYIGDLSTILDESQRLWQQYISLYQGFAPARPISKYYRMGLYYSNVASELELYPYNTSSMITHKWFLYVTGAWATTSSVLFDKRYDSCTGFVSAKGSAESLMGLLSSLLFKKGIVLYLSYNIPTRFPPATYHGLFTELEVSENYGMMANVRQDSGIGQLADLGESVTPEVFRGQQPAIEGSQTNNLLSTQFTAAPSQGSSEMLIDARNVDWEAWDQMILGFQMSNTHIFSAGAKISQVITAYGNRSSSYFDPYVVASESSPAPDDYNFVMLKYIAGHLMEQTSVPAVTEQITQVMLHAIKSLRQALEASSHIEDQTILTAVLLAVAEQISGGEEKADHFWESVQILMFSRPDFKVYTELKKYCECISFTYPDFPQFGDYSGYIASVLASASRRRWMKNDEKSNLALAPAPSPAATVDSPWSETDAPPPPYMLSPTPLKQTCLIYSSVNTKR